MKKEIHDLTNTALFVAIIILLSAVPVLGYIPLGAINATTIHIPVIIGAALLGWKKGAFLGGVFGLTSLIKNTVQPNATSFLFSPFIPVFGTEEGSFFAVILALVPRILIGVTAYLTFASLKKAKSPIRFGAAGFVGSMTNTLLVMAGIVLFFGESYSDANGIAYDALIGTVFSIITGSGLVEAIAAAVICSAVGTVLLKEIKRK